MNLSELSKLTEDQARETLERIRWSNGVVCPHCGRVDGHTKLKGRKHRPGVWKCNDGCARQVGKQPFRTRQRRRFPKGSLSIAEYGIVANGGARNTKRGGKYCQQERKKPFHRHISPGKTSRPVGQLEVTLSLLAPALEANEFDSPKAAMSSADILSQPSRAPSTAIFR